MDIQMTLDLGQKDKEYKVEAINLEISIKRRLEALGLTKGTKVKILNKNFNGSIIFMLRGSRLAIGKRIAKSITIYGG